jgi:hypothetical protein
MISRNNDIRVNVFKTSHVCNIDYKQTLHIIIQKYNQNTITPLWAHKTTLTPPRSIEVQVPS